MCVKLFVKVVMGAGVHFHVAFKKKSLVSSYEVKGV